MEHSMIDQQHTGTHGTVFDGAVEPPNLLGWDVETCKAVNLACRFSIAMSHDHMAPGEFQALQDAVTDLDLFIALHRD